MCGSTVFWSSVFYRGMCIYLLLLELSDLIRKKSQNDLSCEIKGIKD